MEQCIRTGRESEKFRQLQRFLDQIKDNIGLHFLYVIIPLNTDPTDNMQNVIAAVSQFEYAHQRDELVSLNQLTGKAYSPATAQKYLDAYRSGQLSFFEETSQWGTDLTGLLPLFDSKGEPVAALCMDIDITSIHVKVKEHLLNTCLIIFTIGLLFATVFIVWADKRILRPIRTLEEKVTRVTRQSHDPRDADAIALDFPEIQNDNEMGLLARAVEKMNLELRDSMKSLVVKERELARASASTDRDELTHVGNLRAYNQYADSLQLKMTEGRIEYAIVMADVDDLKRKNDLLGMEDGNRYLINCCAAICNVFHHSPVFRVGGDEFVAVLTGEDFQNRKALMDSLRERFRQSQLDPDAQPWARMSVSVGMAEYRSETDKSVEDVLRRADHAMYEARSLKMR